jgi:hypothetical protein
MQGTAHKKGPRPSSLPLPGSGGYGTKHRTMKSDGPGASCPPLAKVITDQCNWLRECPIIPFVRGIFAVWLGSRAKALWRTDVA